MKKQNQKTILFIDSDKELIHSLEEYLEYNEIKEKHSLNFIFVKDAKDALKKISEFNVDLIVLELILPIINGYYFLNAIKKKSIKIPIIIYTKLRGEEDLAKIAASGVNNVFIKQLTKIDALVQELVNYEYSEVDLNEIVNKLKDQIKAISDNSENNAQLKIIQCPRCHVILAPKSHFCNNCGQKIFRASKADNKKIVQKEQ